MDDISLTRKAKRVEKAKQRVLAVQAKKAAPKQVEEEHDVLEDFDDDSEEFDSDQGSLDICFSCISSIIG